MRVGWGEGGQGEGLGPFCKYAWVSFCLSRPFVPSAHWCVDCVPVSAFYTCVSGRPCPSRGCRR